MMLRMKGYRIIAGADEVGRGAWAGPVIAAAVVLPDDLEGFLGRVKEEKIKIDDSKVLTALQRQQSALWLKENVVFGIGGAGATVVNRKGIVMATRMAFRKAIRQINDALVDSKVEYLLADGYKIPRIKGLAKSLQIDIVKGDRKSLSIAAASIIAKVHRDGLMTKLGKRFKDYDWQNNKGYGALKHRQAVLKCGLCRYHRVQFVNSFLSAYGNMEA